MSSKVQEILTNSVLRTKIGVLQKYKQCLTRTAWAVFKYCGTKTATLGLITRS
jgi:hypothetical protein